mmetsp:Transcript_29241/g.63453  ORF Transcript_29241/g.63453 Transcript_29241/m.63453 type:complete len:214 (-) Transcript_29241:344-985(-)
MRVPLSDDFSGLSGSDAMAVYESYLQTLLPGMAPPPSSTVLTSTNPVPSPVLTHRSGIGSARPSPPLVAASSHSAPIVPPLPASALGGLLPTWPSSTLPSAGCMAKTSELEPGSEAVPTVGSLAHYLGTCKPCAFLYTKGCMNGVECKFCHLCEFGEKKRRQKMKKEQKKVQAGRSMIVGQVPLPHHHSYVTGGASPSKRAIVPPYGLAAAPR